MDQAFDITEALSQKVGGLTPTELARDVGLEEARVRRLLAALEARSAVEWDSRTRTYRLGRRLRDFITTYFANADLYCAWN